MNASPLKQEIVERRRRFYSALENKSFEDRVRREAEDRKRRMLEALDEKIRLLPEAVRSRPRWKRIVMEVAERTGVTFDQLVLRVENSWALSTARHECFYRLKTELGMSYPEIAARFGDRNHTTVIHGVKCHAKKLKEQETQ